MHSPDSSPSPTPAPTAPPAQDPAALPDKSGKSGKRGIMEDIVVTGFGMATSAAVAYGSFYAQREFNFALYTWMANFIIPVGAIACGFVAAVGYWAGSRLFHHRPTRLLLLNIVLVALGTFFSIHHLDYSHAYVDERPLSDVMSFPDYLVAAIEHMSYRVSSSGSSGGEATELGMLGWGVAALQILGFSIGGFIVYGMLIVVPYCDRCSKYFGQLWHHSIPWKDTDLMVTSYSASAQLLEAGQLQSAINKFAAMPKQAKYRSKGLLTMILQKCPMCENRRLKLTAQKLSGNQFTTIAEVSIPTEQPVLGPAQKAN